MEQTISAQLAPIPLPDNTNAYLDTLQPIAAPETQHNFNAYPLPITEPNYGFLNPLSLDTPSAFDPSAFDPSMFDPSVFDLPTFGGSAFDLSCPAEFETQPFGPGLFWNLWEENVDGPQDFG